MEHLVRIEVGARGVSCCGLEGDMHLKVHLRLAAATLLCLCALASVGCGESARPAQQTGGSVEASPVPYGGSLATAPLDSGASTGDAMQPKPPLEGPDESADVSREIARQLQGLARDIRVRRVNDIQEPDDLSVSDWSYGTGYRVSYRIGETPVEVRLHVYDAAALRESLDPGLRTVWGMPSGSGLTPDRFARLLDAYAAGSGKTLALAVGLLDDVRVYDIAGEYTARGRAWPASECYAVAWRTPVGYEGAIDSSLPNYVVHLDPASWKATYLGQFEPTDGGP